MGPLTVLAKTAPNTFRLQMPPTWRAHDEFNVARLRRYLRGPLEPAAVAPTPVPDGGVEHEVARILKFRMRFGRPHLLVRWAGEDASGDTWEPVENLTHCDDAIRDFERTAGLTIPRPLPPPPALPACPPSPAPPTGFTVAVEAPLTLGADLLGRRILYWWPDDGGWQLGRVANLCTHPPFTHVVAYQRRTSSIRGTVDTLIDRASYGQRWVLLDPVAATGLRPATRSSAAPPGP